MFFFDCDCWGVRGRGGPYSDMHIGVSPFIRTDAVLSQGWMDTRRPDAGCQSFWEQEKAPVKMMGYDLSEQQVNKVTGMICSCFKLGNGETF